MKRIATFLLILGSFALLFALSPSFIDNNVAVASTAISGVVFRDYNGNGTRDANEPGVSGVTVTAYPVSNDGVSGGVSATTDANGNFSLGTADGLWRIEVTGLPSYLYDGAGVTTMTFADAGENLEIAVQDPSQYSSNESPDVGIAMLQNGDPIDGNTSDLPFIQLFNYMDQGNDNAPVDLAMGSETGPVWGLAWVPEHDKLFSAAFLRRHVGMGPQGLGGIYVTDLSGDNSTTTALTDLGDFGIDVGELPYRDVEDNDADREDTSRDAAVFGLIGKRGLGDMEYVAQDDSLWVTNLNRRELVRIDLADYLATGDGIDGGDISTTLAPDPGCSNGDYLPFGLKYHDGLLYVGVVCTAETSQNINDLAAYVYTLNPDTRSFTGGPVFSMSLNYPKGSANLDNNAPPANQWNPWSNDINDFDIQPNDPQFYALPQPILSDIEFDSSGAMVLAFLDRASYQLGHANCHPDDAVSCETEDDYIYVSGGGDILRVVWNGSAWELENNASTVDGRTGCGAGNNQGPGGGEFYCEDHAYSTANNWEHQEIVDGALVQWYGADDLLVTAYDQTTGDLSGEGDVFTGGVRRMSNSSGNAVAWYQVYNTESGSNDGPFGKANGLGDLELLDAPAPLEIGNRLWCDAGVAGIGAENGIQDPGEAGLANAQVTLECDIDGDGFDGDDDVSATTTTDADGNYLFWDGQGELDAFPVAPWDDTLHIIPRRTTCRILINPFQNAVAGDCGADPTLLNAGGADEGASLRDSDGQANIDGNSSVGAIFTTGRSGQNDHSLDFGFLPAPQQTQTAELRGRVWHDQYFSEDHKVDGIQDVGEPSLVNVVVELYDANGNLIATDTTDAEGAYEFTNLSAGDYRIKVADSNFQNNGALDETDDANDWHATMQDEGNDDSVDSDGDESSYDVTVTLDSGQIKQHIDFGFFQSCVELTKTGPYSITPGEAYNYHFKVENCGDVVLHGGVSVYDELINPDDDHKIWWHVVYPGEVYNFDESYTAEESQCPSLTNNASAVGHPLHPRDDSSLPNVTDEDSWTVSCYDYDWGDAPASYGVTEADDGPRHTLGSDLMIGNSVDAEEDGQPTSNADGDDNNNEDDEDAFAAPITLIRNGSGLVSVPVQNPLSDDATLYGWIDFNGDGDFLDGGEYVSTTVPANTNAPVTLDFGTVPANSAGNTFARFRITTNALCLPGVAGTYRDEFNDSAYNNSDGTLDWSGEYWQELGDDDSPCNGRIRLCNDELRFSGLKANEGIKRQADLTNATSAYLTFDWRTDNLEEKLSLYISADGVNFVLLDTFGECSSSGAAFYDISDYISPNTTVRFMNAEGDWSSSGDLAYIDNLEIKKEMACVGGLAHDGEVEDHPVVIQQGKASLGDIVWSDNNANGIQDANETGVDGVSVELFKSDGTSVGATTTANGGKYRFDNLDPGDYYVQFTLPNSYAFSPKDQGSDDAKDSDADVVTGQTDVTTLMAGENDMTWDAGMYETASLGDFVWWDQDEDSVQDTGEPGIKNVTVTLKDANGDTVATTTTNDDGAYRFENLAPGNYTVVFTLPNNNWDFSPKDNAGDDTIDSDADPSTGEATVSLSAGDNNNTIDAGMTIDSSYTITKENTTIETEIAPGDPISFTIIITNTGDTWLTTIPLQDNYDTEYLTYIDADPASKDNDDDGVIDWSDLTASFGEDLAPSESFTVVVHFTAKAPTDNLENHQTINTATAHDVTAAPDGNSGPTTTTTLPSLSDQAPADILNPVGVAMGEFVATFSENQVQLQWQTLSESDILGFNILRIDNNIAKTQINPQLIFARNAGADMSGFYQFATHNTGDDNAYVLEIIHLDGSVEQQELAMTPSVWTIK